MDSTATLSVVKEEVDFGFDIDRSINQEEKDFWIEAGLNHDDNDEIYSDDSSTSESELDFDISQIAPLPDTPSKCYSKFPDHFYNVPVSIDHNYCESLPDLSGRSLLKRSHPIHQAVDKQKLTLQEAESELNPQEESSDLEEGELKIGRACSESIKSWLQKSSISPIPVRLKNIKIPSVNFYKPPERVSKLAGFLKSCREIEKEPDSGSHGRGQNRNKNGRFCFEQVIDEKELPAVNREPRSFTDSLNVSLNEDSSDFNLAETSNDDSSEVNLAETSDDDSSEINLFLQTNLAESEEDVDVETVVERPLIEIMIDECLGLISNDKIEYHQVLARSQDCQEVRNLELRRSSRRPVAPKRFIDTEVDPSTAKKCKTRLHGKSSKENGNQGQLASFAEDDLFMEKMINSCLGLTDDEEKGDSRTKSDKASDSIIGAESNRSDSWRYMKMNLRKKFEKSREKSHHNAKERYRRKELAKAFRRLRDVIPKLHRNLPVSKLYILNSGATLCQELRLKDEHLCLEKNRLTNEVKAKRKALLKLKLNW